MSAAVFENDPYLQYQPGFAYTLPIQLFINGITLTLLLVLFIHLLFTAQYHYPLAPLNFILQFSSVFVCLVSVLIKVVVVLKNSSDSGDRWPYSLTYVSIPIPPAWWNTAQDTFWFLLQALCAGLSNITHIHFLTLLYPSRTEARLILFVLGPLAIASSGLTFVALSNNQTALDIGDAIRNTLNSTLLLIFSIALLMWGLVVNRRRAWRSDGGTAMFGIGSLTLAVISTSCNFVAIAEDGIDWLQHLLFAAVLWQIWLGWWWWVGSGMGIGEVEDIMEKAESKKRKAAKRAARQRAANGTSGKRTRSSPSSSGARGETSSAIIAVAGLTTSVTGILRNRSFRSNSGLRRRQDQQSNGGGGSVIGDVEEGIEMTDIDNESGRNSTSRPVTTPPQQRVGFTPDTDPNRLQPSTNSETSSTSRTPSLHPPRTVRQFFSFPTTWLLVYLRQLQHAHEDATKKQVLQRAELRQRVFASGGDDGGPERSRKKGKPNRRLSDVGEADEGEVRDVAEGDRSLERVEMGLPIPVEEGVGWGLGSFGIKEHEASARRLREAGEILREGRLLGDEERRAMEENAEAGEGVAGPSRPRRRSSAPTLDEDESSTIRGGTEQSPNDNTLDPGSGADGVEAPRRGSAATARSAKASKKNTAAAAAAESTARREEDWTDVDSETSSSGDLTDEDGNEGRRTGKGWSWWGPLKNWRRTDRSDF